MNTSTINKRTISTKTDFFTAPPGRSQVLQGAYLMIAARALGLDCGPMSGFNNSLVDETFFADTRIRSNFLCNLGYGDAESLHPRSPRHAFDQACRIL